MHEILMLMLGLLAQEAVDQVPEQMELLVRRLAGRLPGEHADIMAEVWLAELHAIPGKLPKLLYLIPLFMNRRDIVRAASEQVQHERERRRRSARAALDENESTLHVIRGEMGELVRLVAERRQRMDALGIQSAEMTERINTLGDAPNISPERRAEIAVWMEEIEGLQQQLEYDEKQDRMFRVKSEALDNRLLASQKRLEQIDLDIRSLE